MPARYQESWRRNGRDPLGRSLTAGAPLSEVGTYHQHPADTAAGQLASDNRDTVTSRGNLASAYQAAGWPAEAVPMLEAIVREAAARLAEAVPMLETTLRDRERLLGADHPDTLTSRNSLASGYRAAGRLAAAVPLLETTLRDRERLLGAEDPTR